jgi:hypothetical protein
MKKTCRGPTTLTGVPSAADPDRSSSATQPYTKELVEPSPYSYDYEYFRGGGLDAWIAEYDRIYDGEYQRILDKYGAPFQFRER